MNAGRLHRIKVVHTAIWSFYNIVILYLVYAVWTDRIDTLFWTALGLVGLEVLVLLIFRMTCPLTVLARRHTDDRRANFDIYLPECLARNNKLIYGTIVAGILIGLALRLGQGG